LNEGNKPIIKGELSGKKLIFLLDTGCDLTRLNTKSGGRLKTLGELGVELEDGLMGRLTNSWIVLMDNLILGRARFLISRHALKSCGWTLSHLPMMASWGCDFCFVISA